ncbi:MAG TPA: hypothetical protein VGG75_09475 [Trebonia sp.]
MVPRTVMGLPAWPARRWSGSMPIAAAMSCGWTGSGGGAAARWREARSSGGRGSAASAPWPPRTGSGNRNTSQARTNAGSARMMNDARQDSAAMSPVKANPAPAPSSSPVRM